MHFLIFVAVLAAEGIKKSLHFEEKHENGEGSESSSPQKETVCITVDDEASCMNFLLFLELFY